MKELHEYKISNPDKRFERIYKLILTFQKTKILDTWGMALAPNMTNVKAKQLYHPKVLD